MADTIIKLLDQSFEEKLFKFELDNRSYFEKTGFPRADSYYDFNKFKTIINELIEEQEKGLIYMYLIIDGSGNIVGRINLVSIMRGPLNKAEIGYRVGEDHQSKGYGTNAVRLVLDEAVKKHKLHRVEAGTSPDNIGSQIVLIKNGFQFVGRYNKFIYQNDKWHDSIILKRYLIKQIREKVNRVYKEDEKMFLQLLADNINNMDGESYIQWLNYHLYCCEKPGVFSGK